MNEELLARLCERIEFLTEKIEKQESALESVAEAMRKIQLARAREQGYLAGAAAIAAVIGGVIARIL
jgi:hypothetical protein